MVIRATESFNLHCNNVARQVEEKCCPCYRTLTSNGNNIDSKDGLIFNLRISREFRFTQFVYTVRDIPNRICKTASNFEKEILKLSSYSSLSLKRNMQNVAISRCCFRVTFCKQRRRNEQRIVTHEKKNTRRSRKSRAAGKRFTNSSSVLPTSLPSSWTAFYQAFGVNWFRWRISNGPGHVTRNEWPRSRN